jgi:hypothetical protein
VPQGGLGKQKRKFQKIISAKSSVVTGVVAARVVSAHGLYPEVITRLRVSGSCNWFFEV